MAKLSPGGEGFFSVPFTVAESKYFYFWVQLNFRKQKTVVKFNRSNYTLENKRIKDQKMGFGGKAPSRRRSGVWRRSGNPNARRFSKFINENNAILGKFY